MKKMIMILMATVFTVAVYGQAETYYSFAYAYDYDSKTCYVTDVLSSPIKERYDNQVKLPTKLQNLWFEQMKLETSKWYNFDRSENAWELNKSEVTQKRAKIIREYKYKGFTISEVKDFSFDAY